MDFMLTEQQKMMKKLFSEFAEKEVKPLAAEIDEQERFPRENVEKMAACKMLGIPYSREYGGAGADYLSYILAVEELSKKCATTGVVLSAHTSLGTWPIAQFGTEAQKQKYLPDLCTGKKLAAFGLTEPNAGTDAAGQQTTAVKDGDDYILNGTKIFITNAGEADVYIIFAMTDKSQGTRGISAFIVEKGMPGFTVGQHEKKLGIRGSATSELIFNNVRLSKDQLLGQEGKGFKIAMMTLDGGRIGIAAQALGIAQGAIDETVPYVKARKQFGRPIAKFQNTQFQLADMQTKVDAARWLVYDAAMKKEKGLPYSVEAAKAKLFAAEVAMEVTTKAIQLLGGYGYTRDYPVERMFRDAKITEIYEGTSEVQRMVISGAMLK
ncbi:acyl-CoA dehydrogenase [Massilicoli timonensis]|uniref:Acyl-CoA dehydrogenase n=2 Tax=Massilicoli timonensis TaxID=2015901 RepID=A0ABT1SNJ4_9FIRM|nr:acyl-CoA dehydrogenase [Massilicoli timonensis]MCQ5122707.1 acyl-CoA dehydrogenase [Massilicoli timonensis]HIR15003.1 acyl-CoA dehydrogenase [Candidatus Onthosoma merdavium]